MRKSLPLLSCLALAMLGAAVCSASVESETSDASWEAFKTLYKKVYVNEEENEQRRSVWEKNVRYIEQHNAESQRGEHNFTLAVNQFADLTSMEFKEQILLRRSLVSPFPISDNNSRDRWWLPRRGRNDEEIDWRKRNAVSEVKDQVHKACPGAGWSFAVTGTVEGCYAISRGKLMSLSEQQLIDCSKSWGTRGCSGGDIAAGLRYTGMMGLESEEDYRYRAEDQGACEYAPSKIITKCNKFLPVPPSEIHLLKDLIRYGPVAATIDASKDSFRFYKKGIYHEPFCSSTNVNHGVLVVGNGRLNDEKFWLVKNSFGVDWGQAGYIFMTKDQGNQCGIASRASVCTLCT